MALTLAGFDKKNQNWKLIKKHEKSFMWIIEGMVSMTFHTF